MSRPVPGRLAGLAVLALAGSVTLGGCSGDDPTPSTSPASARSSDSSPSQAGTRSTRTGSAAPSATEAPSTDATTPQAVASATASPMRHRHHRTPATLPPGDPGTDAPSVPDPGTSGAEEEPAPPRRRVPRRAMVGTENLAGILRGTWTAADTSPIACTTAGGAVAERTVGYRSDEGEGISVVVESVSTYPSKGAADAAVRRLEDRWRECGWKLGPDPRLGSASASAAPGDQIGVDSVTVISTEGVTMVLGRSGPRTQAGNRWTSVLDIAMGNSCPATPHGCD